MMTDNPPAKRYDYIRQPQAIYDESFRLIDHAMTGISVSNDLKPVITRMVHAIGDPSILTDIEASPSFVETIVPLFQQASTIFADSRMVQSGIIRRLLPDGTDVVCHVHDDACHSHAQRLGITRSAAALDLVQDDLDRMIVVIGNAPTALFHLLERIHEGGNRPLAIIATPVGYVGAAESKKALAEDAGDIPFITLHGKRGGSAIAASIVNALSIMARQQD